jgi:hypothetical protein
MQCKSDDDFHRTGGGDQATKHFSGKRSTVGNDFANWQLPLTFAYKKKPESCHDPQRLQAAPSETER